MKFPTTIIPNRGSHTRRARKMSHKKTHSFAQYPYQSQPDLQQHAAVVRRVAADGMVLLKNDQATLPLSQGRIALFGNTSYELISGGSGFGGMSTGHYTVSLVEGLRAAGFTVNEQLLKTYSQYLRQANAKLFPHGKPSFSGLLRLRVSQRTALGMPYW